MFPLFRYSQSGDLHAERWWLSEQWFHRCQTSISLPLPPLWWNRLLGKPIRSVWRKMSSDVGHIWRNRRLPTNLFFLNVGVCKLIRESPWKKVITIRFDQNFESVDGGCFHVWAGRMSEIFSLIAFSSTSIAKYASLSLQNVTYAQNIMPECRTSTLSNGPYFLKMSEISFGEIAYNM